MANVKRANTSGITKSGVAIADVPDRPTIGTATAGIESATVTYTAATTGGTATTFTATSTPGSLTGTGSSPITVTGLTADTSYTFTVRASNSTGNSPFSSASNSVTALAIPNAYESIATVTPSGTSVTFSSIPQTYKHLQVRAISRTTRNDASVDGIYMRLNGDTSGNYSYHFIQGDGASTSATSGTSTTTMVGAFRGADAQTAANIFTTSIWDILDYTNTNKFKTTRSLTGFDANGSGGTTFASGNWRNTNAVTSITMFAEGNFVANSHFALYGIKG